MFFLQSSRRLAATSDDSVGKVTSFSLLTKMTVKQIQYVSWELTLLY